MEETQNINLTFEKVITFLFLTLGPLKIIKPFSILTQGIDHAFKRKLAFNGIIIATISLLIAAFLGEVVMKKWGISIGSMMLMTGILLFLIALRTVMEQYSFDQKLGITLQNSKPLSSLAISPIAFPTVVTPYGIGVLIMLMILNGSYIENLTALAIILVLDLVAMLYADKILKSALAKTLLSIAGSIIGIFQLALAIQLCVKGIGLLFING